MSEPVCKTTHKKPKGPVKGGSSPKKSVIFIPKLIFDPGYVSGQLIPNLQALVLQTELGGDTGLISRFRFAGGMGGYAFGLYHFDVKNHVHNSAVPNFLFSVGFTAPQIIKSRRGGELNDLRIKALNEQLEGALQIPAHQMAMRRLNETWVNGLVADLQRVPGVLEQTNPIVAKQIFNSPELQLRLLEIADQFGTIKSCGPMECWLSGKKAEKTKTLVLGQELTREDLREFVVARLYCQDN